MRREGTARPHRLYRRRLLELADAHRVDEERELSLCLGTARLAPGVGGSEAREKHRHNCTHLRLRHGGLHPPCTFDAQERIDAHELAQVVDSLVSAPLAVIRDGTRVVLDEERRTELDQLVQQL
eukprot:329490-Prymnesium_polylepis.2